MKAASCLKSRLADAVRALVEEWQDDAFGISNQGILSRTV
jgi:hypothetical protein